MEVAKLVENAKGGDVDAFTNLVQRYQAMALGYAYSKLGDFHLAEDAAQQAFIVAHRNLSKLDHPERFGGWLRGIVRFECLHLLRSRKIYQLPIETIAGVASSSPGPPEVVEQNTGVDHVLAAVNRLPHTEREAAILFYIHDHSQRDVARFLDLPETTINNRLRSARKRLRKERALAMTKDAFEGQRLPDDFAARIGEVVRVHGPLVDARFAQGHRPPVLSTISIIDDRSGSGLIAQVTQHLDDDIVRGIIAQDDRNATPPDTGMRVADKNISTSTAIDPEFIKQVIASMRRPTGDAAMIETGIKVVDLLAPLPAGGVVGLMGDAHTGKMVLVEELIHRLTDASKAISVLVFVESTTEANSIRNFEYRTSAAVEAIYLPVVDASPLALQEVCGELDAVISLSQRLANDGLYPAIDPRQSTSQILDPAIVGEEHADIARHVRHLLTTGAQLPDENRLADDTALKNRAAQLQRLLTQPFFVAEAFSGRPGVTVSRSATIEGCRSLLDGAHDDRTPDTFYMTGTLEDALTRT